MLETRTSTLYPVNRDASLGFPYSSTRCAMSISLRRVRTLPAETGRLTALMMHPVPTTASRLMPRVRRGELKP